MKSKHRLSFATACASGIGICPNIYANPSLNILASNIAYPADVFNPSTEKVAIDGMGNVYGRTNGNIFELSGPTHQTLTTIDFRQSIFYGVSTLIADAGGNFYATSRGGGGPLGDGAVIELSGTNHQAVTALVTFNNSSGQGPNAITLVNGILYGTTEGSGGPAGTVFRLSGPGYQTFAAIGTPGFAGGLVVDGSGNVFGPAQTFPFGNTQLIDKVSASFDPNQGASTVFTFNTSTGTGIQPGITVDAADNVYGVLTQAGPQNDGVVFELSGPND